MTSNVPCSRLLSASAVDTASPPELATKWQEPPGDRLEHGTACFVKILCSVEPRGLPEGVEVAFETARMPILHALGRESPGLRPR